MRASDITKNDADIKIASANARAEEAQLKTEELRARFAWRRLTLEQFQALADSLRGFEGEVWLDWVKTDPETEIFRNELEGAFKEAGVEVRGFRGWTKVLGMHVDGEPSPRRERLVTALQGAGIAVDVVSDDNDRPRDWLRVIVGTRMSGIEPQRLK